MEPRALSAGLCILLYAVGPGTALGQSGRKWVDPPLDFERTNPASPPTTSSPAAPAPKLDEPSPPAAKPLPAPKLAEPSRPSTTVPPAAESAQPSPPTSTPSAPTLAEPSPTVPADPPHPRAAEPSLPSAAVPSGPDAPPAGDVIPSAIRQRAAQARRLAIGYLEHWSEVDDVTRAEVEAFYAPQVQFYGRMVELEDLLQEKRRFVERWPIRDYAALPETMSVGCRADAGECRVSTDFSYHAANPEWGRRTQGRALLELVIDFGSGQPLITSETSRVLDRGRRSELR
jgi:hypothetical protein